MRTCSVPACARPCHARGWCRTHYRRRQRHGDVMAEVPIGAGSRGPRPGARLPFQPLADTAAVRYRPGPHVTIIGPCGQLAALTGIHVAQFKRWRRDGVTVNAADRVATLLGMHPAEIWDEWWEMAS